MTSSQPDLETDAISNPTDHFSIRRIATAAELNDCLCSLRTLLQSCVNRSPSASSIGFLCGLDDPKANAYWDTVASQITASPPLYYLFVLAPRSEPHNVHGTVGLVVIPKETHVHRAEVVKLLVRPEGRRHGVGRRLMEHVEWFAKEEIQKKILVLDTATETAAKVFYERLGWTIWGECPEYAAYADGRLGLCTFFYKMLDRHDQ